MSRTVVAAFAGLGALVASGGALGAVTYFGPGSGGSVSMGNMLNPGTQQSTITVTEAAMVTNVTVQITSLVHNWLGDLSASVTHVPSGRSAMLFDRIGYTIGTPDGDGTDFVGHYTFADGGTNLVTLVIQLPSSTAVASGTYAASGAGGSAVSLATTFAGVSAAGDWRLTIKNSGSHDTATFGSWKVGIETNPLPTPGAAVLGMGAIGAMGLRRRR
ncbi:MAG: proprotein convertase P-domain-containing protein [Phycisphaerales bacterium]